MEQIKTIASPLVAANVTDNHLQLIGMLFKASAHVESVPSTVGQGTNVQNALRLFNEMKFQLTVHINRVSMIAIPVLLQNRISAGEIGTMNTLDKEKLLVQKSHIQLLNSLIQLECLILAMVFTSPSAWACTLSAEVDDLSMKIQEMISIEREEFDLGSVKQMRVAI